MHGVFKHLDECDPTHPERAPVFFDSQSLRELHGRQIEAVSYLDGVFKRLFDLLPANTWVIVTSDHGELFGEDRFFGHGPVGPADPDAEFAAHRFSTDFPPGTPGRAVSCASRIRIRAFLDPSSLEAPTTRVWFNVTGIAAR